MKDKNTVNTGDQRQIGVKNSQSQDWVHDKKRDKLAGLVQVQILRCTSVKTTERGRSWFGEERNFRKGIG